MQNTILQINSSSRIQGSVTRDLSAQLTHQLQHQSGLAVVKRDLAEGIDFIDEHGLVPTSLTPLIAVMSRKQRWQCQTG